MKHLPFVLLFSTAVSAQTLTTATEVGVYAQVTNFSTSYDQYNAIPAGTVIQGQRGVGAVARTPGFGTAIASSSATIASTPRETFVGLYEAGQPDVTLAQTGWWAETGSRRSAPSGLSPFWSEQHAYLLTILTLPGDRWLFDTSYRASTTRHRRATLGAWVDVGNDGSSEFVGDWTDDKDDVLAVTATGTELVVRLTTEHRTWIADPASASSNLSLRLWVARARCTFTSYGATCGPTLRATETVRGPTTTVAFDSTDVGPGSRYAYVLGTQAASVVVPGTSCFLTVDPILIGPVRSSSNFELEVPDALGGNWNIQDISLAASGAIATTNGIAATCWAR